MGIDLSEKGGMPNGVRNLIQTVLFVSAGACAQAGHWIWFFALMLVGIALFAVNVVHYFKDNYGHGFQDGKAEGLRVLGYPAPEEELLEGAYEILAQAKFGDGWVVTLNDVNMEGREPRMYMLKNLPPPAFWKERWAKPGDSDPDAFVYGYRPMHNPT